MTTSKTASDVVTRLLSEKSLQLRPISQFRDKALSPAQKRDELLKQIENPSIFLDRYGPLLSAGDLVYFEQFRSQYEVNYYLSQLESKKKSAFDVSATAKNRRLRYLQQTLSHTAYFDEEQMAAREPDLYHQYIGQFSVGGFSNIPVAAATTDFGSAGGAACAVGSKGGGSAFGASDADAMDYDDNVDYGHYDKDGKLQPSKQSGSAELKFGAAARTSTAASAAASAAGAGAGRGETASGLGLPKFGGASSSGAAGSGAGAGASAGAAGSGGRPLGVQSATSRAAIESKERTRRAGAAGGGSSIGLGPHSSAGGSGGSDSDKGPLGLGKLVSPAGKPGSGAAGYASGKMAQEPSLPIRRSDSSGSAADEKKGGAGGVEAKLGVFGHSLGSAGAAGSRTAGAAASAGRGSSSGGAGGAAGGAFAGMGASAAGSAAAGRDIKLYDLVLRKYDAKQAAKARQRAEAKLQALSGGGGSSDAKSGQGASAGSAGASARLSDVSSGAGSAAQPFSAAAAATVAPRDDSGCVPMAVSVQDESELESDDESDAKDRFAAARFGKGGSKGGKGAGAATADADGDDDVDLEAEGFDEDDDAEMKAADGAGGSSSGSGGKGSATWKVPAPKVIDPQSRDELAEEFLRVMQERFLQGHDASSFDYSVVDNDADLDDWQMQEQDEQEKYFEE